MVSLHHHLMSHFSIGSVSLLGQTVTHSLTVTCYCRVHLFSTGAALNKMGNNNLRSKEHARIV